MLNLDFGKEITNIWIDNNDEVFEKSKFANKPFKVLIKPITRAEFKDFNVRSTHATKGLDNDMFNRLIFMYAVLDWENIGMGGKIVPCNTINKETFFSRYIELSGLISVCCLRGSEVQETMFEDEVKNLV